MRSKFNFAPVPFLLVVLSYSLGFVMVTWQEYTLAEISGYGAALGVEQGHILVLGEHTRAVRFEGEVVFGLAFIVAIVAGLVAWWRPAVGTLIGLLAFFLLVWSPSRLDAQDLVRATGGGSPVEVLLMPGYIATLLLLATGILLCGARALRRRQAI